MRILLAVLLWISPTLGVAQGAYYRAPDALVQRGGGAVTLHTPSGDLHYVEGLGWSEPQPYPEPLVTPEGVFVTAELLAALGVRSPTLIGVRFGGSGTVRAVLDIAGVSADALGIAEAHGRLADGEVLRVQLPTLALPAELPDPYRGVALELVPTRDGTELQVSAGDASYHLFTLESPTRVVLDVTPHVDAEVEAETRVLRPGVIYRRFAAPTAIGSSVVHVLEIAPGSGEFRVVGQSETPMPVSALSSGAFAGINAGYFDTRTFDAIGLLKIDGGLLSLPSRQRASIGFRGDEAVIDRVRATVNLRIDGRVYHQALGNPDTAGKPGEATGFEVVSAAGQRAGLPTMGVILVNNGQVTANRVGPLTVPPGGFAVVYPPERRDLALIDPGARAELEVVFDPPTFASVRYAVEAGPLLVADGLPAYAPDQEQFRRGERILDEYTQQAAIGVKPDGTVLFVVADNMIAEELVPLFLGLGAKAAMRLDSGGSTTLVVGGKVVNRSSERKVVSAIVFVPYTN